MARLRGGLFGCGMISEFHLRGWQRIPEVEMVAIGNRTIGRAEERRAQFFPEARVYAELAEMLEREQLDFVDVVTPPALHLENCLLARDAGVHVICQKPLCDNLVDSRTLVAQMATSNKLFAVHENHRYRPWFQTILRHYRDGFFGDVHFARLEHLNEKAPAEAYKLESYQGVLLEYGTHLVDMAIALFGTPTSVYARLHRENPQVRGESIAHVAFEFGEKTALIDVGWKASGTLQGCALVHGTEGEAYFEGTMTRGRRSRFRLLRGNEVVVDEERSTYDDYVDSFYLFERACTDAMLSGGTVEQTGMENLKAVEATFAAYAAAERGGVVTLKEGRLS